MNPSAQTQVFAVIGDPVAHSLSPLMHNAWIADHGLDAVYVGLRARGAGVVSALRALRDLGVAGANVTVPHKELAAAAADRRDPEVQILNAANVLSIAPDGALRAHNTDAAGFIAALDGGAPHWREHARTALVVGAGGAGRAIVFGLKQAGVEQVILANRDFSRAEAAAKSLGARPLPLESLPEAFAVADVIVNATTLGMDGGDPDWPIDEVKATAVVADAVYRPLQTSLLKGAAVRDLVVVDGLGMLIHQGALAFQIWFGMLPDVGAARARLMAELGARGEGEGETP